MPNAACEVFHRVPKWQFVIYFTILTKAELVKLFTMSPWKKDFSIAANHIGHR